jgi:cold shock CspA family protein
VKGEIAARSLTRLEEDTPVDDEAKDLEDAVQHRRVMRCKVDKWLIDRGFGFAMAQGQTVFVHASVVRKAEFLRKDSLVMLKIVADPSREGTQFKAVEAWSLPDWQLESAARLAQESADRARRAAEITARASEQVQYRLQAVRLATPPGLDGMFLDPGPGAEAKKKAQEKEAQLKVPAQVYWDRIVKIYQKHDVAMPPDKIEKMMPNYKGKEHILYNKVCRKFKEVQLKVPLATAAPEIGAGGGFGIAARGGNNLGGEAAESAGSGSLDGGIFGAASASSGGGGMLLDGAGLGGGGGSVLGGIALAAILTPVATAPAATPRAASPLAAESVPVGDSDDEGAANLRAVQATFERVEVELVSFKLELKVAGNEGKSEDSNFRTKEREDGNLDASEGEDEDHHKGESIEVADDRDGWGEHYSRGDYPEWRGEQWDGEEEEA